MIIVIETLSLVTLFCLIIYMRMRKYADVHPDFGCVDAYIKHPVSGRFAWTFCVVEPDLSRKLSGSQFHTLFLAQQSVVVAQGSYAVRYKW